MALGKLVYGLCIWAGCHYFMVVRAAPKKLSALFHAVELANENQTTMTKIWKLHEAWLKDTNYKESYESMQLEFEMERHKLNLTSAGRNSKRPIQFHNSQIQIRSDTDPH